MDTQVVKYFLDIVKYKSFSEAAFHNNISQSSISKHIINLEKEIGCILFDRSKRTIRLTLSGLIFYDHAQKLMNDYNDMLADMKSNTDASQQTINICMHRRSYYYNTPAAILGFQMKHPSLHINSQTTSSRCIVENLYSQSCNFGVLYNYKLDKSKVEIDPLFSDKAVLVLYETHPLASRTSVSIRELSNVPLIFYPEQSQMAGITHGFFDCYETEPNIFEHATFPEPTISLMSAYNLAHINLKSAMRYFNSNNFKIIPFEENLTCQLVLARPKGLKMTHFERQFKEFLLDSFRGVPV